MKRLLFAASMMLVSALCVLAQAREFRPPVTTRGLAHAKFDSGHSFDVQSYTLRLLLPMGNDSLYGSQLITAIARQNGLDTVILNCANITVDSVIQDGASFGYRLSNDTLYAGIAPAAAGEHFALEVFYRLGGRGTDRRGYYWYPQGGEALRTLCYTMSAPQDARYWMPCFDEPWDKADSGCVYFVTVPQGFTVAANGLLQDTIVSGGAVTWQWREDHTIATYLMAVHASQYSFWTDTARTAAGDTVPLNYFVWPQDSALSRSVFDSVPVMINCFSRTFGQYPFDKYGMAAVAPFMFGGMENQTITSIHRSWLTGNDQYGIAHELSHMWFGDLVTCGTWADIWMNEGFASYCEAIYDEQISGRKPGTYMFNNFIAAITGNAEQYAIYDPPMELIYDVSMEYAKGAWVLQMLRGVMGDSAFFAGMREYAATYAYRTAITTEFQSVMEFHYGAPLGWFFDQWVHRPGHPNYGLVAYYDTRPGGGGAFVRLRQASTGTGLFTMPVQLACSTAAGVSTGRTVVWDSTAVSDSVYLSDTLPVTRVMCDPDNWVLQQNSHLVPSIFKFTVASHILNVYWHRYAYDPSPVAGYVLYRSTSAAGPFTRVNQAVITDTVYADTGLVNGTRYYYAVTALMGADTCYATKFSNIANRLYNGVASGNGRMAPDCGLRLEQNRPNPFGQRTTISYQLPQEGQVHLKVYNAAGQLVRTLVSAQQAAGRHAIAWNGTDDSGTNVAAGLYYYHLEADGIKLVRALQYIK